MSTQHYAQPYRPSLYTSKIIDHLIRQDDCVPQDYLAQGQTGYCWMISVMLLLLNLKFPLSDKVERWLLSVERLFYQGKLISACPLLPKWLNVGQTRLKMHVRKKQSTHPSGIIEKASGPDHVQRTHGGNSLQFLIQLLRSSGYFVYSKKVNAYEAMDVCIKMHSPWCRGPAMEELCKKVKAHHERMVNRAGYIS